MRAGSTRPSRSRLRRPAAVEEMGNQAKLAGQTPPELTPHLARLAGAYRFAGKDAACGACAATNAVHRPGGGPGQSEHFIRLRQDRQRLHGTRPDGRFPDCIRESAQHAHRRLGPDHLDVATSWVNLGVLEVATPHFRRHRRILNQRWRFRKSSWARKATPLQAFWTGWENCSAKSSDSAGEPMFFSARSPFAKRRWAPAFRRRAGSRRSGIGLLYG